MSSRTEFLMSLSILLPLAIGCLRFRQILSSFYPIIYLLFIGSITELASYLFHSMGDDAIIYNTYGIIELIFFLWQFRIWGNNILSRKFVFYGLFGLLSVVWLFENFYLGRINLYSPIYWVCYSLTLILLAVNQMNWLIVNERGNMLKNPIFIICIAIIIFYSYKIMVEIFYHYAPAIGIKHSIFSVLSYVNVLFNILLAIAILCIPRRKTFIRQLA